MRRDDTTIDGVAVVPWYLVLALDGRSLEAW